MLNKRIKEIVKESHLEIYGLGRDRVKWEACLEQFTLLLLKEFNEQLFKEDVCIKK